MRGHSQHDLVLHGGLDVALGAKIFRPIVREVVVGRREVPVEEQRVRGEPRWLLCTPLRPVWFGARGSARVEDVKVARLLHALRKAQERVGERMASASCWVCGRVWIRGTHVADRRQLVGEVRAASVGRVLRTGKWHERETG